MRALIWFRADLRTEDNPALHHASKAATRGALAVFAICAEQWRQHDWADVRVEFLLRNLACLSERLKRLNIALRIVEVPHFAQVPRALVELAQRHECDALYFNREYEVNELRRDEAVARLCTRNGLAVHCFDDQMILPPDRLRTREGRCYTVFTPFQRAWRACIEQGEPVAPLGSIRPQPELLCSPDPVPEQVPGFDLDQAQPDLWPAGEKPALRRLADFIVRHVGVYRKLRDFPAADGTSRLSPYLAVGAVSARQCLAAARETGGEGAKNGGAGVSTWITELIWRDFYRYVVVAFPRVSMGRAFKPATERLRWRNDPAEFAAWCAGQTGFPIVDAGLRQLASTGWMHNRLRMIAAMFLTKDLLVDWRWGERHFMRHLVDGDLASNNGGWQWSASTGTDAVPYFRIFNPATQSRRFDPAGEFIRRWVPELGDLDRRSVHNPPVDVRARLGYPAPVCDHAAARRRAIAAFQRLSPGRQA